MKSMVIPSHITVIPNDAFRASALETVTFHAGMTAIGDYAFEGCTKLNNVTMLKNITNLGNYVFANCTSLSNFTWENGSDYYIVGTHFFDGCTAMTQVTLPRNIQLAEEEMDALTKKYNGLNVIPGYMFANTGIVDAVIPDYIIDMGPEGGKNGGQILFEGPLQELLMQKSSATAEYLRKRQKTEQEVI